MDRDALSPQVPKSSPPTGSLLRNYAVNETLVLGLFSIVTCAILILFLLVCVYAIMRRGVNSMERSPGSLWLQMIEDASISTTRIRGLDAKLVEALPIFVYSSQNLKGEEKLECTICLSEFQEGDKVRVLPNCKHNFHIECIDMWFRSHSNCPVCRTDVDGASSNEIDNGGIVVNIGVIEEGQSSGTGEDDRSSSFASARESEDIISQSASQSGRFSLKRMMSRGGDDKVLGASLHGSHSECEGQSQC